MDITLIRKALSLSPVKWRRRGRTVRLWLEHGRYWSFGADKPEFRMSTTEAVALMEHAWGKMLDTAREFSLRQIRGDYVLCRRRERGLMDETVYPSRVEALTAFILVTKGADHA